MASRNYLLARIVSNPRKRLAIPGALIVLIVVLAYLPALRGGFVWDDGDYVTNNQLLHSLKGLWQIWSVPSATPHILPALVHKFLGGLSPVAVKSAGLPPGQCSISGAQRHSPVDGPAPTERACSAWLAAAIFAVASRERGNRGLG